MSSVSSLTDALLIYYYNFHTIKKRAKANAFLAFLFIITTPDLSGEAV
jgi:hypothetical protein